MRTDIDPDTICICTLHKTCKDGDTKNPSTKNKLAGSPSLKVLDQQFGCERCNLKYGMKFKHLNIARRRIVNKYQSRNCNWHNRYWVVTYDRVEDE